MFFLQPVLIRPLDKALAPEERDKAEREKATVLWKCLPSPFQKRLHLQNAKGLCIQQKKTTSPLTGLSIAKPLISFAILNSNFSLQDLFITQLASGGVNLTEGPLFC